MTPIDRRATREAYREAYGHARAIADAAVMNCHGYWAMKRIPAERTPMVEAISLKMRIQDRGVGVKVVEKAVDDVLGGLPPRR